MAYLVAAHHGLDTADYTFAYIAGWAGRDNEAITSTARRVLDTARTLIAATDPATSPDPAVAAELAATAQAQTTAAQATATAADATRHRLAAALDPDSDRLRVLLLDAQTWFQAQAAQVVFTEAVTARGYTPAEALGYGVGYAPASWTGLVDHLRTRGHTDTDLLAAGVAVTARHGRLIDRFRARITFPIHDQPRCRRVHRPGHHRAPRRPQVPQHPGQRPVRQVPAAVRHPAPAHRQPRPADHHHRRADRRAVGRPGRHPRQRRGHRRARRVRHRRHRPPPRPRPRPRPGTEPGPGPRQRPRRHRSTRAHPGHAHPTRHPAPCRGATTTGKDLGELHATSGPAAVCAALAAAQPAGLVYAEAHLAAHPPADTPEARVAAARAAAAHAAGLTLGQRADLGALLISQGRDRPGSRPGHRHPTGGAGPKTGRGRGPRQTGPGRCPNRPAAMSSH